MSSHMVSQVTQNASGRKTTTKVLREVGHVPEEVPQQMKAALPELVGIELLQVVTADGQAVEVADEDVHLRAGQWKAGGEKALVLGAAL